MGVVEVPRRLAIDVHHAVHGQAVVVATAPCADGRHACIACQQCCLAFLRSVPFQRAHVVTIALHNRVDFLQLIGKRRVDGTQHLLTLLLGLLKLLGFSAVNRRTRRKP